MYIKTDRIIKVLLKTLVIIVSLFGFLIVYQFFVVDRSGSGDGEVKFSDVDPRSRYHEIAEWAVRNGIVRGYLDGSFRPDELISEKKMMVMLYSYFGLGELKYITTMIDESNIEVKNVGEVYGKLRDAGIFVDGTNVFDGSVLKREDNVTVRDVLVNLSKFFGDDNTSSKDFKILKTRVSTLKDDSGSLDKPVTKIEFLEMLYVMDTERADYNNEIVVNKKLEISDRFWLVDRDGVVKYVMMDNESGVLITLTESKNGYEVSVLNSGSTPYEYFGYSIITYGDGGVKSVFDTEKYIAFGGTSSVSTKIDGKSMRLIVIVLGDQVVEIDLDSVVRPSGVMTADEGVFDVEGNKLEFSEYEYVIQHVYSK